jgi:hypothetical protein
MDQMSGDGLFNLGFVLGLAAMWLAQRMLRALSAHRARRREAKAAAVPVDAQRRADEIQALHERLAVLERIATDPAERTAREIESLR